MEGSDDSGRADQNEGTTLWLEPGSVNIVLNDMDLSNDLAGPLQIQMDWLNYLHLFCMHAAHTGSLPRRVRPLGQQTLGCSVRELWGPTCRQVSRICLACLTLIDQLMFEQSLRSRAR